jgi:hypothetical protein
MAVALKRATQEVKDLGDAKSELDIQLSQYQLQLSTAQSEVQLKPSDTAICT